MDVLLVSAHPLFELLPERRGNCGFHGRSEFFLRAHVTSEEAEIVPIIVTFNLFSPSGFLTSSSADPGKVMGGGEGLPPETSFHIQSVVVEF